MAQLVIAASGAAVGFAIGGTEGAKWGWTIGSLVGSSFTAAQKNEGPRLSDLTVSGSSYGTPLPFVQGHPRLAGAIVWASSRRELTTTSSSGKGGNPDNTTYTYEVDLLIELTDNPGFDVTRIWSNGKLIYNITSGATNSTIDASNNTNTWSRLTVYSGSATQLPDPDYEAAVGVGNAPAYRGRCSVFIKSLGLGTSGIIPNLTFEITANTGPHPPPVYLGAIQPVPIYEPALVAVDPTSQWIWSIKRGLLVSTLEVKITSDVAQVVVDTLTATWSGGQFTPQAVVPLGNGEVWVLCSPWLSVSRYPLIFRFTAGVANADGTAYITPQWLDSFQLDTWPDGSSAGVPIDAKVMTYDPSSGLVWLGYSFSNITNATLASVDVLTRTLLNKIELGVSIGTPNQILAATPYVAMYGNGGAGNNFVVCNAVTNVVLYLRTLPGSGSVSGKTFDYDPVRQRFVSPSSTSYSLVAASTGSVTSVNLNIAPDHDTSPPAPAAIAVSTVTYQATLDRYVFGQVNSGSTSGTTLYIVNPDTGTTEKTLTYEVGAGLLLINPLLSPPGARRYVLSFDQNQAKRLYIYGSDVADATLEEVVTAVCLRAGLAPADFDATPLAAITLPVHAMAIGTVSTARMTLEMLVSAYFFTAVASDKIHFRPRGQNPAATLLFDDLGVVEFGGKVPESLPLTTSNDLEIPSQIALTYSNINGDYQPDTQNSDRLLTDQVNLSAVQLSLGFTPSEAKAIADKLVMDGAVGSLNASFSLNRSFERLEPSDVVIATDSDGSTYRLRLLKRAESGGVLKFDAVRDDASILSQAGLTAPGLAAQTTVQPIQNTRLSLLDIPMLSDGDNQPGYYYAVEGEASGWRGALLYSSSDNVTYSNISQSATAEVLGTATTLLPSPLALGVFDESSRVTVNIGLGELVSVSRAELLANTMTNAAFIGNNTGSNNAGGEIIQFRTATLLSAGVYELSGLLRGRRGTEWAMGSHAIGDRFVLLGRGTSFVPVQTSDLGRLRFHKAVTIGQRLSAASVQLLTLNGVNLKPLSPVNVRANRDTADTGLTWTRRSRLSTRLTGSLPPSAPLGEASEAYDIEIYSSNAFTSVLRTLSSTTAAVTYSNAQQIADFGVAQAVLSVRIYQLSAIVGRGYPVSATV